MSAPGSGASLGIVGEHARDLCLTSLRPLAGASLGIVSEHARNLCPDYYLNRKGLVDIKGAG
jgi:hypothetical protein